MSKRKSDGRRGRRKFLKTVALGAGAMAVPAGVPGIADASGPPSEGQTPEKHAPAAIEYPRVFRGDARKMIAFPLGGVAAGSLSLGGRGDLREWWIFNRPDKGKLPAYAFPLIWAQTGSAPPVVRVLEARYMPPYEGPSGLDAQNAPGLPRLESSVFTGEFPLARIDFEDRTLPVHVALEAFTPFIPLDADESGLPVAVLRYRLKNPGSAAARVSVAWSIENPVGDQGRSNDLRQSDALSGLFMRNPFLPARDPLAGNFVLATMGAKPEEITALRGWTNATWWQSALMFWDDFSKDGRLGPQVGAPGPVGALCVQRELAAGAETEITFLLAWHFPNRTPKRMGWRAPQGHEDDLVGNFYSTRFKSAWDSAEYAARHLPALEDGTRQFADAMRRTTLPGAVKDAATANLAALVTATSFRTSDGSFHGFEGCNEQSGCCHGNCSHVYAYEATIASLFPSLSRSLRDQQFGYLTDDEGRMDYREYLPFGIARTSLPATDGQMACLMKLYWDWRLGGDTAWLKQHWPAAKRALEFSWVPGGWDPNRDGVMEGVQHNTYDVEFIGPNPLCGVWYLGALRACEEMAKAVGDTAAAEQYRGIFERGSKSLDAELFNGEYYIQKIGSIPPDKVAPGLLEGMGGDTEHPTFQVGEGCLADQLLGQYHAHISGLGELLDREHVRKTLNSIYKYNFRRSMAEHASVQRTYALNDEAGLLVCHYPEDKRPETPFPYFAEVWTGIEYSTAALMACEGMVTEGVEIFEGARRRFDGLRRNPWDEPECGFHYARPMAAWAGILALSGFRYHAADMHVEAKPVVNRERFTSFWSTGTGWGTFTHQSGANGLSFTIAVNYGSLAVRRVALESIAASGRASAAKLEGRNLTHKVEHGSTETVFTFDETVTVGARQKLTLNA